MNYPLISEYIEAIKAAEDNFEELTYLRPVFDDERQPVITSGNFAVVFKMQNFETGKFYALKCFTKEQEGRTEAYHQIAEGLKSVDSPYLISIRYLEKELFVDTDQTTETEFPVLLMDWIEGKTLDKYLRENLDDKFALEMLAYRFSQLGQWLIPQPFAHGDLKPDNILVREDGTLVLVDYDGMYVPTMKGQKARELGSPDFRHPLRTEDDFDEHIDDFPLVSILLSLKAISYNPQYFEDYGTKDRLLFSSKDYQNINNCEFIKKISFSKDRYLNTIVCTFFLLIYKRNINLPLAAIFEDTLFQAVFGIIGYWLERTCEHKRLINRFYEHMEKEALFTPDLSDYLHQHLSYYYQLLFDNPSIKDSFSKMITTKRDYWIDNSIKDDCGIETDEYRIAFIRGINETEYKVPSGIIVICELSFASLDNLKLITIPNTVLAIGESAFMVCRSLERITLSNSIHRIERGTFLGCIKLKHIYIPKSVYYIGSCVFVGCHSLEEIILNNSETIIEDDSIGFCPSLKSIIVPKGSMEKFSEQIPNYKHLIQEK